MLQTAADLFVSGSNIKRCVYLLLHATLSVISDAQSCSLRQAATQHVVVHRARLLVRTSNQPKLEHGESPNSNAQFHYVPAVFNPLQLPSCLPASSQAARRHNVGLSVGESLRLAMYRDKSLFREPKYCIFLLHRPAGSRRMSLSIISRPRMISITSAPIAPHVTASSASQ